MSSVRPCVASPAVRCETDTDCASVGTNMECYNFGYSGSADIIGGLLWPKINTNTDYYYHDATSAAEKCAGCAAGWYQRTDRRCDSSARKVSAGPNTSPLLSLLKLKISECIRGMSLVVTDKQLFELS